MDESYKKQLNGFLKSHNFLNDPEYLSKLGACLEEQFSLCNYSYPDDSSFMVDTKITKPTKLPTNKKAIVIDVGGTNVRRSIVVIDRNGNTSLMALEKASFKDLLEGKDFFKALSSFITPLLLETDISDIAICFSFPFVPTEDGDAVVCGSAKGLDEKQFKGKKILESLKNELRKTVDRPLNMSIVNDATSLLLYLAFVERDPGFIPVAAIAGTGTNCCVYRKREDSRQNNYTAICTEVGHFDVSKVKFSDFDYIVDKASEHPGSSMIEIQTSGFYLYKVFKEMVRAAISENVFNEKEKGAAEQYVDTINDTKDIDRAFTLGNGLAYLADQLVVRASGTLVEILRAGAKFSSSSFEFVARNSCLIIEGSTYYLLPGYKEKTESLIGSLILEPTEIFYPIDNKGTVVLYGAALSVLKDD